MKRALVLTLIGLLTLGVFAFAQGELEGEWSTSIKINPGATDLEDFFGPFSSTLDVSFTVSDWVFASKSGFSADGFVTQSFTADGVLGAFSFSTTLDFEPYEVTAIAYDAIAAVSQWDGSPLTPMVVDPCIDMDDYAVKTYGPAFDDWTVSGSVSIAGVTFEGLFFLEAMDGVVDYSNHLFYWDGATAWTQTGSASMTASSGATLGSGFRFTMSASLGAATLTNYTYFNLSQGDAYSLVGCPVIGKLSTYSIASAGCGVAFTENYTMIEGLTFACWDFDLALKMTCSGFGYFKIIASEIPMFDWLDLTFGITFTTTSKSLALCGTLADLGDTCFAVDVGLNTISAADAQITSLEIYGISLTYSWNGVTFTSDTSFNTYYHNVGKRYIYGDDEIGLLVPACPFTGVCVETVVCGPDENVICYDNAIEPADSYAGYYELWCIATERFHVWEKFSIDVDSDACCGGLIDFTVDTYFGDHQVLEGAKWTYQFVDGTNACADADPVAAFSVEYEHGTATPTFTGTFTAPTDGCKLMKETVYGAGTTSTLFDWVATEIDFSLGIGSNWTADFGLAIDAFGWDYFSFGFTFEF